MGEALEAFEVHTIELSSGQTIRVHRWSVRKAMVMGRSIAKVIESVFGLIEGNDKEEVRVADIISMTPDLMEKCAKELIQIVIETTTDSEGPQLTEDQVYDEMSLEDFADVLGKIIEVNVTSRMLGKWMGLLQSLPMTNRTN